MSCRVIFRWIFSNHMSTYLWDDTYENLVVKSVGLNLFGLLGSSPNYMKQSPWKASQQISSIFGTRSFITALATARHQSLSWARPIRFMPPIPLRKDQLYYYPPVYTWVFKAVPLPQISSPKPCVHLSNLACVPHASPITESASGYVKFVATHFLPLPRMYLVIYKQ
jgi:hypothetical protein